ncbi:MAG: formate--tetrahydrofolate ligase [Candidatus Omnitrophica bacterium]|nr:formate--tetrahydrofolate ligase [Candidatus Omnitrophota bacterium]
MIRIIIMKPITSVADKLGVPRKNLELFGDYKAKISLDILKRPGSRNGKYVVVTGITPTHLGEGKTVTTIGLSMALNKLKKRCVACIRQPSIGPFFGVKGGGVGGGKSLVLPEEDINLHLTGDIHAVSQAHNLCASFIDNHLYRGNLLNIDIERIYWRRVVDVNDRALRRVMVSLGGGDHGVERQTGFDITAASELMAILALSESFSDLRRRISKIIVALTKDGKPVTCEDLKVAGSMALLLRDAIKPNLVQTSEGTPCIIHTGPFANITHGNSSIIADRVGLKLADFVVTESGFGADCGLEKFVDIKCRQSALKPDVVVLVASIRALKIHSGIFKMTVGRPLDKEIKRENLKAVELGSSNLKKQIENSIIYDVPCVVAINRFKTDPDNEIALVKKIAVKAGALFCVVSDVFAKGSGGGADLARAVIKAAKVKSSFKFLYSPAASIKEKMERIARTIYGAKAVSYEPLAQANVEIYEKLGLGKLPVCVAKTHLSLSHDPALKGAPKDFVLPVREIRPSVGAGFLYALCGKILTMPSLPSHPVGECIDVDAKGRTKLCTLKEASKLI